MAYTIASVSTPSGSGAISIVRLCGERSLDYALCFFHCKELSGSLEEVKKSITPSMMYLGRFKYKDIFERCFLVYFKAPKSYTGEDMVEIQIHGGVKLTQLVLSALFEAGAKPAGPGEYTRRAFLNGKLSLSEAEGILSIINAESESALSASYRLANGKIGQTIEKMGEEIKEVLAVFEASFDYPDEMADEIVKGKEELFKLKGKIAGLLAGSERGRKIKSGIKVAIAGRPNVGKSSLLNALLGEERAIVTSEAGTTRDTVSESIEYQGVKLTFLDTAGIRESAGLVESIGIQRTFKAVYQADVILYVLDDSVGETLEDKATLEDIYSKGKKVIIINNKADLTGKTSQNSVSALTGEGIKEILDKLTGEVKDGEINGEDIITEERHILALSTALKHLESALAMADMPEDLIAEDLREALKALGEISGREVSEEVVDKVFSRFCVGK